MAKVATKATEERTGTIAPIRPTLSLLPHWMERVEEMLERPFGPLFPMLRFPEELAAVKVPPVDVFEEGDTLVVKAELPGLKKEEIEVNLAGDLLTLSGKKEKEEKVERKDYHRIERMAGAFTRTVMLPVEVETEKVTAKFENGVLEIRAPKTPEAKARTRRIEVG
jgi:HSP20 family protein